MRSRESIVEIADRVNRILALRDKNNVTPREITLREIARMPGWTMTLNRDRMCRAVHYLRTVKRLPICSNVKGYFVGRSHEDLMETMRILRGKIKGTEEALAALQSQLNSNLYGSDIQTMNDQGKIVPLFGGKQS